MCLPHFGAVQSQKGRMVEPKSKGGKVMETTYQTLIVKFGETIENLNRIFDDAEFWGTSMLKGWVESYESTRFTETDKDTAVITSEYNMDYVKEWLERHATIKETTEY